MLGTGVGCRPTTELAPRGRGGLPLLSLQASLARPGALQVITHPIDQLAEAIDLHLDEVAVLERPQPAVVRAAGDHIARLKRGDGGDPLEHSWDLVGHVAGVVVLPQLTLHPEADLEVQRV